MGAAVPDAIGAKFAHPDRLVVALVTGDGHAVELWQTDRFI
ncbi:thiamine pyrophosphate-dependent enzyme [Bradyrhizobium sp. CSA112]